MNNIEIASPKGASAFLSEPKIRCEKRLHVPTHPFLACWLNLVSLQKDGVSCGLYCWKYIHAFHLLWYDNTIGGREDCDSLHTWQECIEAYHSFHFEPSDVLSLRTKTPELIEILSTVEAKVKGNP
jgi:hypothetical protein